MKRLFDLLSSILGLTVLSPLLLVTAILTRIKLGSPLFFRQQRPGLQARPFYIYKFRTMTFQRDALGQLLPDEMRLTPFGLWLRRLSLDELPQLLNIIKGDLSLVGPRPLLMEYLPYYSPEQARRHEVRPGLTGWAQVNGRNALSWEDKFKLDVWYVDNRSFWLDMKILWLTVGKVLKREGVSQDGALTMPRFRGGAPEVVE